MASFEKVQLPVDTAARSKVISQIKAEIDALQVSPAGIRMVDQHGKVDVHLKSGSNPGGTVENR